MFRVDVSQDIAPTEHSEWNLSHSGVDWRGILSVPNDQSVILADTSQETAIRTESQKFDTVHHTFEDGKWLAGLVAPENNWCLWSPLELSSELASCE